MMEAIDDNEGFNQEIILIAQDQLTHAFPNIDAEIIWGVLTSYECSQRGIEDALNKLMEINGNNPIDFIEEDEMETIIDNTSSRNNNSRSRIDNFDDENDFRPTSSGNYISNLATYVWNNITKRRGNYEPVEESDSNFELGVFEDENKKDR
jgi:hypothetical protein